MTTTTLNTLLATIPHRERYRSLTAWLIRYLRQSQMDMPSHLQDIITGLLRNAQSAQFLSDTYYTRHDI